MKLKSLLTVFGVLALVTCAPEPVRVSQITLNTKALTLEVGESETLTATISPYNADNPTIIWASDDASIAKVSGGTVTAVSPGTARITAKADDGGISDACVVTVPVPFVFVSGVTLEQTSVTMKETEWLQLHATVSPSNADDPSLTWTSSNKEIVQVTSEGLLLAMKPGTADITVTTVDGGKTATCKVTVKDKVTGLTLEPPKMDILVGDEADIIARLQPEDASVNISWQSASPEIVTVDDKGHIKALDAGDAVICAATDYKGLQAFCKIHVRNKIESVSVSAPNGEKELYIGETLQLTTKIAPANLSDLEFDWKSSDAGVATINSKGLLTAKSKGTATITIIVKNGSETKTSTYELKVIQPVTSITIAHETIEMFVDDVIEIVDGLGIQVAPDDADVKTWHYGYPSSQTIIKLEKGKITGLKAGVVDLSVIADKSKPKDLTVKCTITVKAKVGSITISGSDPRTIQVGGTLKLTATVLPKNANQEMVWSSSDTDCVTVDDNGNVKGIKAGEATITVASKESPEITASCIVKVENIPVESVTLNKTSLSLVEGKSESLTVTVKPDNVVDKSVMWESSDNSIATVSDKGIVTAVSAGSATITATSVLTPGKKATCTVTVSPQYISVTGVTLDKTAASIELGESLSLIHTIVPDNASNKGVIWSSSDEKVAKVNASGVVSGVGLGTATITVTTTDSAITASCEVTVVPPPVQVESITLSHSSATLAFGQSLSLTATVLPKDAADPSIIWSSSDVKVATVSDGTVKAGSTTGTATITAKSKSNPQVSATCKITVKSKIVYVNGVSLDQVNLSLYVGQSKTLKATVSPSTADNKAVEWSVEAGGYIRIDQSGKVTGLRAGKSAVIVTTVDGGYMATCSVIVSRNEVKEVTLNETSLVLKIGETFDLKATVKGEDSSVAPSNSNVKWTSSDTSIVSVDKGRVMAKKSGTATIKATSADNSSKYAECAVTVIGGNTSSGGLEGIDFDDWNF